MTEPPPQPLPPPESWQADRDIHKTAVDLFLAESDEIWQRSNAMLVAHTILLGGCGYLLFGDPKPPRYAAVILAIAGLLISGAWKMAIARGLGYMDHYLTVAREIEATFPHRRYRIVTSGQALNWTGWSRVKTRNVQNFMIWLFAVLYFAALVYAVVRWAREIFAC